MESESVAHSVCPESGDTEVSSKERGAGKYGCSHYRRRCKIRAPCCHEIFDCWRCHDEAKDVFLTNDGHNISRHEVTKVICSLCETEQDVQQDCIKCGVRMGLYYCAKCKLFDDDFSKNPFHCDECGICRSGGGENFFHCIKCGCCHPVSTKDEHPCREGAINDVCPICHVFLFDTEKRVIALSCGHTMHLDCLRDMERSNRDACPLCRVPVRQGVMEIGEA